MIQPLPTDTNFRYSPDPGRPDCICSRCGARIQEYECPIRCWTTNEQDEMDEHSREYRYCRKCCEAAGIIIHEPFPDPDLDYDLYDPYYDQNPEDRI